MKNTNDLQHLAIIMDGNGRWAQKRRHNRFFGHVKGAKVAKKVIKYAAEHNIQTLTLFAFSSENWARPKKEVQFLMTLLVRYLNREKATLIKNNISFQTSGDLSRLPVEVQQAINNIVDETKHCTKMNLVFALSYGGRQDILQASKKMYADLNEKKLNIDTISEDTLSGYLQNSCYGDPDLIIRTSGEKRLSNFFLWQAAYSEFEFHPSLWPDFTLEDLSGIIENYKSRHRRFGNLL